MRAAKPRVVEQPQLLSPALPDRPVHTPKYSATEGPAVAPATSRSPTRSSQFSKGASEPISAGFFVRGLLGELQRSGSQVDAGASERNLQEVVGDFACDDPHDTMIKERPEELGAPPRWPQPVAKPDSRCEVRQWARGRRQAGQTLNPKPTPADRSGRHQQLAIAGVHREIAVVARGYRSNRILCQ
jgi:hypothetical protein